jgi:trigger factor
MPIYHKEEITPLHFTLEINLEPADYEGEYDAELSKYRKQAALKGFRKGKTPTSVLRKMFGKSILAEVLNKQLQDAISGYIRQHNLYMLGNPIPSEDNDAINLDARDLHQYAFKFEIGIAPDIEVRGAGPESTYERFAVVITDEMVTDQLNSLQERLSIPTDIETGFTDTDSLVLHADELLDEQPKEDGLNASFSVTLDQIYIDELRQQLLAAKVGDSFRINLKETFSEYSDLLCRWLETTEEGLSAAGEWFNLKIEGATRNIPAELDQEFFDNAFGPGKVSNVEEAKENIRKSFEEIFLNPANSLMFVEIRDRILRETEFELPTDFLKKWMRYNDESLSPEKVEEGFDKFLGALRWSIIRNKLATELKVEVTDEELEAHFVNQVYGYFGSSPYVDHEFIHNMAHRLMQNEESVNQAYEEIFTDKLFMGVAGQVTVLPKPISREDFRLEMDKMQKQMHSEDDTPASELSAEVETIDAESDQPETE